MRIIFLLLIGLFSHNLVAQKMLILGDSLSAAYGMQQQEGWPHLLQQSTDWQLINASISGETTAGGLARLPALLQQHKPDAVLVELSAVIGSLLRDTDLLGRYGGEEFGVVLPETDINGAELVANRICKAVAEHQLLFNGQTINVTVSIGASSFTGQTPDELIQQADMALYSAKRQGRNRVIAWQEPAEIYLKKVK